MWDKTRVIWATSEIVVLLAFFVIFFAIAMWLSAIPLNELPLHLANIPLPRDCPAVTINHGQVLCWGPGTLKAHPVRFGFTILALVACWAYLVFTKRTGRGFYKKGATKNA
jgi:hypothetical protein